MCQLSMSEHVHLKWKLQDFEPFSTVVWVCASGIFRFGTMQVSFIGVSSALLSSFFYLELWSHAGLWETVFNIYFWYVVLQDFIQIPGIYFLHENFFYFLKANYDIKVLIS